MMAKALRILLILLAAVAAIYAFDTALWHVRPLTGAPFGSYPVRKMYAVKQKNGSTSFMFDDPAPETCSNAMFPHGGAAPCWYVARHPEKRVEMCDDCSPIQLR